MDSSKAKQAEVKPKQADDPHDLLEVAPGVALVAPSNAADPTDEELSNLLRAAARRRPGAKARNKSDVAAGPSAPPVDTTFRPTAVNAVRRKADRSSISRRMGIAVVGAVLALSVVVGAAAWQFYGDAATQMAGTWGPRLGLAPPAPPQESALAGQPSANGVQGADDTLAREQPVQSAPQGAVAAAAASPPAEAPTLQSMARDVATLGQKVEQLQATIEQLKASQDQMSRDLAKGLETKGSEVKGSEVKASEAKASDQTVRPRTSLPAPRPAVVPARKPISALRQPPVTASPASSPSPAPYYGQRQPEPSPPATQQLVDPESASAPRPPLPLHQ